MNWKKYIVTKFTYSLNYYEQNKNNSILWGRFKNQELKRKKYVFFVRLIISN